MAGRPLVPSHMQQMHLISLMRSGLEVDWNWYGQYLNSCDPSKSKTPEQWKLFCTNLKKRVYNKLKKQTETKETVSFNRVELEVAKIILGSKESLDIKDSVKTSQKLQTNPVFQNILLQQGESTTSTPKTKQNVQTPKTTLTPEMMKWKQRISRSEEAIVSSPPPPKRRQDPEVEQKANVGIVGGSGPPPPKRKKTPEVQNDANASINAEFMHQMATQVLKTLMSVDTSLKSIAGSLERICQGQVQLNTSNANARRRSANEEQMYLSEDDLLRTPPHKYE